MNEADHKRRIVDDCVRAGLYARRIEDRWSVGFPDLLVITEMGACFVEVKMIRGRQFSPSPRQWVELNRLNAPKFHTYGIVVGITEDPTTYYFSFPAAVVAVNAVTGFNKFIDGLMEHTKYVNAQR